MFSTVLTLAGKDWRIFWADRRAALLCFAVPILLASAFGMIFDRPSRSDTDLRLPLLVALEGDSSFDRAVLDDVLTSPRIEAEIVSSATIDVRLRDRHPGVAVVIPAGCDRAGGRPVVEIRHHPLCSTEARWAEGAVTELLMKRYAIETYGPIVSKLTAELPFETRSVNVAGPHSRFNSYSHSFCGMTLQYILFWGMESGLLLLRERRSGVWNRLRAAPVSLHAMLVGKALATAGIAMLQVLTTFAFGYFVFGVTVDGSVLAFGIVAFAVGVLASGIGLLVAAIGGTETRARSISILAILGLSMIGGLWLPTFLLPAWLRDVALALPTTWAMRALDGSTWQGLGLIDSLFSLAALFGFGLLFLGIAFRGLVVGERRNRSGQAN